MPATYMMSSSLNALLSYPALLLMVFLMLLSGCTPTPEADLILTNGRVYTFTWSDPTPDGTPSSDAPYQDGVWRPDAEAVAVRGNEILFVGSTAAAEAYRGARTRVIDVQGGTILPGLVDSHTHVAGLGANLERVDLVDVQTEEEAVERVAARAAETPEGEWIVGWGWDEGAWANRYPDMQLLTERVPDHPAMMRSLHGFAVWGNRLAFEQAGITAATEAPVGGEIRKDADGNPSGLLLNNATDLLTDAVPPPSPERFKAQVLAGLQEMARSGYTVVHEAGVPSDLYAALEDLEAEGQLPVRVYAMLSASDEVLLRTWLERGPDLSTDGLLMTRSVKAYYDGALGSRGARLLEDYSDRPGHRGVSGENYGFNQDLVAEMIRAGFQVGIHAIGDAGNRETLAFFEKVLATDAGARDLRHRIEHAQVVHPDDFARFQRSNIIASMEPPHAVEDKPWAEDRLGPERIKGSYAWRTFRQTGVRLIFNSDLAGSDHNIFYGLHAAITRRSKDLQPEGGWYPDQAMTPEEALRAYSVWPAFASFLEEKTGVLAPGKWADLTVLSLDPLVVGVEEPARLFEGAIQLTVVGGRVVYQAEN